MSGFVMYTLVKKHTIVRKCHCIKKKKSANAKTKAQISCAVTAQLISDFCFRYMDSTISLLLKSKMPCF